MNIKINALEANRRRRCPDQLRFGEVFGDHMFKQRFQAAGGWTDPMIEPLSDLTLHPASSVLHYGQEIFEGLKAYRRPDGGINLFRPNENVARFNRSAHRLAMPTVDETFHMNAIKQLVALDEAWVPTQENSSLYIRPTMIATSTKLGLGAAADYIHFIITSPVGPYFKEGLDPVSVFVSDELRRAVKGGVGEAKTGGNYAASLLASESAADEGFTQVLWLDAIEGRYVEEVGAMNIFFVFDDSQIVTPALSGSILSGITRDSILKLAPTLGYHVKESRIDIEKIIVGIESGRVTEVFGSGTAAVVSPVGQLSYQGNLYTVNDNESGPVARNLFDKLTAIQYGYCEDAFDWVVRLS